MDDVKGIIYVKDLLQHADAEEDFDWKKLIRPALFVPEKKRIDDLLGRVSRETNSHGYREWTSLAVQKAWLPWKIF